MSAGQYDPIYDEVGYKYDIDPLRLKAHAIQESGENPTLTGKAGEWGMMQFMPGTAAMVGLSRNDAYQPATAIDAAGRYLAMLDAKHTDASGNTDVGASTAAYNGRGQAAVNYAGLVRDIYAKEKAGGGLKLAANDKASSKSDVDDPFAATLKASPAPAAPTAAPADKPAADDPFAATLTGGPPPTELGTPAGGPKAGEQPGVYSKAGQAAGDIPGQRPTATSPAVSPPVTSEPGPGERGVVGNLLAAGREGYANTPGILTPGAREAVEGSGWAGRNLLNPALGAAGAVLGAGGAVGGVLGQGAYEAGKAVGGEALGRDLYIGSQAVPATMTMLPPGTRLPGVVGRTAELPPRELPPNYVAGVAEVSPEAQARSAGTPKGAAEPIPPETGGAAGAQWAGPAAPATGADRVTRLEKSVATSAEDRAGQHMQDDTRYVPNIPDRTLAAQDFDSRNALDEKVRMAQSPEFREKVDAINRERNRGMVDLLASDAKDANALEAAHETRKLVSPDEMGVFTNEQPVDASRNLAALDKVLQSRAGKRDAITAVLNKVRKSFFDADGNLETSPSQLYGVRQNITDLLQKGVKGTTDEADAVRASKAILTGFLPELDKTITGGASDFQRYLQAWHELSKPIDRMEFLQQYTTGSKKVTGGDGYLQPNRMQKMLSDVLQGHKARGANAAKSLTDEEIANIEAVRNETAAQQLKDRQAGTRGSDSFQQINRAGVFSGPVGNALGTLARMGGIIGSGGALNLLYEHGVRPGVARRREIRIAKATAARENALLGGIPPTQ